MDETTKLSLHVCCPCHYPHAGPAELLIKSGKKFGVEVHPYGVGKVWGGHWNCKIDGFLEYAKTVKEDYKMMVDGDDSLIVRDGWDTIPFICGDRVVASCGRQIWPFHLNVDDFPEVPTENRFLNAGCIVGPTKKIVACLESINRCKNIIHSSMSDQEPWCYAYFQRHECVIDYYCLIGQVMSDAGCYQTEVRNGWIYNKHTHTFPFVIHYAGRLPGREAMAGILDII